MRSVALLLIGIHLVYAGMYSHIDIHTASKGVPVLSEFVPATMVNGTQVDSEINRDWFRGAVDEPFQQNNTQIPPTMRQTFKDNKNIAMERFNQAEVTDSPRVSQPSKPVGIQHKSVPLEEALQEKALQEKALQEKALLEKALKEKALLEKALQEKALQEEALQEEALRESVLCSPSRSSSSRRRPAQ